MPFQLGFFLLAILLLSVGDRTALADPPPNKKPNSEYVNVLGGKYTLPGPNDTKASVLLFLGHDCPISNGYAQEIVRLTKEYSAKQIAFCVVYADADLGEDDARKHAKEYGFLCPAILDPEQTLVRRVGATVKPECAVLAPSGELLYLGRIDNRYADFGKRREQVTSHELRDVLEAILAGKPIAPTRSRAIGCDIDLLPQEKEALPAK